MSQSFASPSVVVKRRVEWGFKILGAFVGTDEYLLRQLNNKMNKLHK